MSITTTLFLNNQLHSAACTGYLIKCNHFHKKIRPKLGVNVKRESRCAWTVYDETNTKYNEENRIVILCLL